MNKTYNPDGTLKHLDEALVNNGVLDTDEFTKIVFNKKPKQFNSKLYRGEDITVTIINDLVVLFVTADIDFGFAYKFKASNDATKFFNALEKDSKTWKHDKAEEIENVVGNIIKSYKNYEEIELDV